MFRSLLAGVMVTVAEVAGPETEVDDDGFKALVASTTPAVPPPTTTTDARIIARTFVEMILNILGATTFPAPVTAEAPCEARAPLCGAADTPGTLDAPLCGPAEAPGTAGVLPIPAGL